MSKVFKFKTKNELNIKVFVHYMWEVLDDEERIYHEEQMTKFVNRYRFIRMAILAVMLALIPAIWFYPAMFFVFVLVIMVDNFYQNQEPSYTDKMWQLLQEILEARDDDGERERVLRPVNEGA